jgi:hypothetical protein
MTMQPRLIHPDCLIYPSYGEFSGIIKCGCHLQIMKLSRFSIAVSDLSHENDMSSIDDAHYVSMTRC